MQRLLAFLILSLVKVFSMMFYRVEINWPNPAPKDPWKDIRLFVFLNHTSLYEPLFIQVFSFSYLWRLSGHMSVPGADVTLSRPLVGRFWKLMMPNIASVTRKKDHSWSGYLRSIKKDDVIMIAAEGRMKRPNGLDKYGRPMTVRGGVADIIETLHEGKILLCLSGGLHHVQRPGEHVPRLFKTLRMNLSYLDVADYKSSFSENSRERKIQMVQDLQLRLERDCPKETLSRLRSSPLG